MLFLRMGPRFLFIRSDEIQEVKAFLIQHLEGKSIPFHEGLELATEDSTLCFLTEKNKEKTSIKDAKEIVLVNQVASVCLSEMINSHVEKMVYRVDMGPASMIMRIAGDEKKIMKRFLEVYQGELVNWEEGICKGEKGDTILSLTQKPINSVLKKNDMITPNILLYQPVTYLYKALRIEGTRFITQNLEQGQWYELRINIYDSEGKYQENYERLVYVLSKLEIGMILGETWTKDHALSLFSVLAYQIRFFTYCTPEEIKKVLVGLEYTFEGERLVDYDLYYRNKKISWIDIEKKKGRRNKMNESRTYREELYTRLSRDDISYLEKIEAGLV
ncbi:hypothetical protein [Alkaliphilus hydrothermalis]|uniref:Uncharacterized protein n=1 Tax=Alkaliphilus hydrothermalis TaxID=1482730 RepID=A0ABS2NQ72_9FIRM|nr:hypothetical protein [Alkaliphilus hydrothermalis]MBM7614991.1 hypothetical protein [Alkaliphilus hydrothermalis]